MSYQPKTGARCSCRRGVQRDNCSNCEGTGYAIDFAAIHAARRARAPACSFTGCAEPGEYSVETGALNSIGMADRVPICARHLTPLQSDASSPAPIGGAPL